jgi:ParB family chromosome partitioning protein
MVQTGSLSEGHARALLGLGDERHMLRFARDVVEKGWSVRDLEAKVRGEGPGGRRRTQAKTSERQVQPEVRRVEDALRNRLQTDVRVTAKRKGRGFVTITYYSNDDLARLLERILGEPFGG